MLGGADNTNGELPSYITGANIWFREINAHALIVDRYRCLLSQRKLSRERQEFLQA